MTDNGSSYPYRTRGDIPANVLVPVAEIDPAGDPGLTDWGQDAYCSICGPQSSPHARADLWAVRQKTVDELPGPVWKYCREHVPDREWQHGSDGRVGHASEMTCTDCFMVAAVGSICDVTGRPH